MKHSVIAVLGAGSWGTAVAIHLAKSGHRVLLWGRVSANLEEMQKSGKNERYLPHETFPHSLSVSHDLNLCMREANEVIIAVPSHAFTDVLNQIQSPKHGLAWLTKGLDPKSHRILSELVAEKWGKTFPMAVISGPSFAKELAQNLPTALVVAGNDPAYSHTIHALLHQRLCRVYDSNDIVGVQWCGAIKNIIAIACGVSDGLSYGANARAALITRGVAEMSRLGTYFGGRQETFMGLAGLGDLVLTCTDNQSRNRRFGLYLGQGISAVEAESRIGQVVEGKHNAAQVCALAHQFKIELPICEQVQALLEGRITPQEAVIRLMNRPAKEE